MRIVCPVSTCRTENDAAGDACSGCGTPLGGYARLLSHAARLFNHGLSAAREGRLALARDLFSAVVYWYPFDREARNALAMTCLALDDRQEARRHWEAVLQAAPGDRLARQGLERLEQTNDPPEATSTARAPRRSGWRKGRQTSKAKRRR